MSMLPGIRVVVSPAMPAEQTLVWRTQRKWCHRLMHRRDLAHKVNIKKVACAYSIQVGDVLYVNQTAFDTLHKATDQAG